jgi:hypothetical protein
VDGNSVNGWLAFAISFALACGGLLALVVGARACDAQEPTQFGPYAIEVRVAGEAQYIDLVRGGRIVQTLGGSLDTLCDPPLVAGFDADGDGATDLYFRNCRGHGYLTLRGDTLEYVDQGDRPESDGWWARQVLAGGTRWIVLGVALCIVAFVGVAIAGPMLRPRHADA